MKKQLISIVTIITMATSANAFIGIDAEVGGGVWLPKLSGNANTNSSGEINFESKNMDDKSASGSNYLYADFSHFMPVIPNARIEKLSYLIDSKTGSEKVAIKQNDFIAYWGAPFVPTITADSLNINYGLSIKNIKGTIDTGSGNKIFNKNIPLAYLNVRLNLPFAPLKLEATTKILSYNGSKITDNEAKMSIKLPVPVEFIDFNLDIGYKSQNLIISENLVDSLDAKVKTSGAFFGLNGRF